MKKLFKRSILSILVTGFVILAVLTGMIMYTGSTSAPKKSDVIIVLGCQIWGKSPSLSLKYRLEEALELYNKGYAPYIIVSGGQGNNEDISEAEAMKLWLVNHGVSNEKILEEGNSTSTYENLKFSKVIMEEQGFKSAILVSNDFHIFRALWLADNLGISSTGAPAHSVWYLKPYSVAREIPSLLKNYILYR